MFAGTFTTPGGALAAGLLAQDMAQQMVTTHNLFGSAAENVVAGIRSPLGVFRGHNQELALVDRATQFEEAAAVVRGQFFASGLDKVLTPEAMVGVGGEVRWVQGDDGFDRWRSYVDLRRQSAGGG